MEPFLRQFGQWSEDDQAYYLPSEIQALMNSLPLLGKFLGALCVGTIIERIGHRYAMALTCCVQIVGPISKSSKTKLTAACGGVSTVLSELLLTCQQFKSLAKPLHSLWLAGFWSTWP